MVCRAPALGRFDGSAEESIQTPIYGAVSEMAHGDDIEIDDG